MWRTGTKSGEERLTLEMIRRQKEKLAARLTSAQLINLKASKYIFSLKSVFSVSANCSEAPDVYRFLCTDCYNCQTIQSPFNRIKVFRFGSIRRCHKFG